MIEHLINCWQEYTVIALLCLSMPFVFVAGVKFGYKGAHKEIRDFYRRTRGR